MSNLNTALNGIVTNVDALASKVVEVKASVANKVSYVSDDKGRSRSPGAPEVFFDYYPFYPAEPLRRTETAGSHKTV